MRITHLTSAHERFDIRIFHKQCVSLAKISHYSVSVIVADGLGDEQLKNISIYDVGNSNGRLSRFIHTTRKILLKAIELNSDIYHLHDPELIPVGLKLKKLGKKIIFDAHEDLPKQILTKPYLNKISGLFISSLIRFYESYTCSKFDFIITATSNIKNKFLAINQKCEAINNYPIIGELDKGTPWGQKKNEICYVGGISEIRGIKELVLSLENFDEVKLNLLGEFNEEKLEKEVRKYKGWNNVNYYGVVNRKKVAEVLSKVKIGIVTFYPSPNHIDAQPNKMFEYMSSGVPIIASNFPLWKQVVEGNNCGVVVDPQKPSEISNAIQYLINNEKEANEKGENGRKAIKEIYNWKIEEEKLFEIYKRL